MSYKSRQKKRAIGASKRKNRDKIAGRWYLTIVKRKTCCAVCGGILKIGAEMIYRHTPREARCTLHPPTDRVRTAEAWVRQNRK